MLGKLFKSKSLQNVGPNPQVSEHPATQNGDLPRPINSFEDSYTREILYGNSDFSMNPVAFNSSKFRLVVSQDGGNLRSKQVLYDSSSDGTQTPSMAREQVNSGRTTPVGGAMTSPAGSGMNSVLSEQNVGFSGSSRLPPSHTTPTSPTTPKSLHNINDLNDYMFGRGLPSNERNMATKIHLLPHFSSYRCVLISNLFSISDCVTFNPESEAVEGDWNPQPVLPIKEMCSDAFCKSPGSFDLPSKASFNSRFSIGIIIPLEDSSQSVEDVIGPFWTAIAHHLIVLQTLVTRKLLQALKTATVHNICPYINNRRVSLPKGFLQMEYELSSSLQKFIRLVCHSVNSPRILNINSVMAYALQTQSLEYKSKIVNWALEVINWLEFKDGRNISNFHFNGGSSFSSIHPQVSNSSAHSMHNAWADKTSTSSTFLASLLALIMPLRDQLNEEPYTSDSVTSTPKHVARIVIMTSNSVVAKKLIFILSGVIPNVQFCSETDVKTTAKKSTISEHESRDSCQQDTVSSPTRPSRANTGATIASLKASPGTIASTIGTNRESSPGTIAYNPGSNPGSIPGSNPGSTQSNSPHNVSPQSPREPQPPFAKPIPIKSRASPDRSDSASLSVSSKSGWEVPTKSMASVSFNEQKGSTEDVNVTAARQIPSSQRLNNSTSIAYLSSSLNSSLSSSASNYSLSKLGSSFMDKWRGSLVGANKPAMPGYNFDSMDGALSHDVLSEKSFVVSAKSPSPAFEYDEPIWEDTTQLSRSASPGRKPQKCALSDDKLLIKSSGGETLPSVNIDRTKSSIYLPNQGESGKKENNAELIKSKLANIMSRKTHWVQDGQTIRINTNTNPSSGGVSKELLQKPQRNVVLNPNVAFLDAFRPEYIMQSCPANPRLENQVISTMKNDLLFHHNNCGKAQVTSTTVFVSLRAREIKLIELSVGGAGDAISPKGNLTPPVNVHVNKGSGSPVTSYFSGVDQGYANKERKSSPNAYRTTIKKVFTPYKNSGNKKAISDMDAKLEKLTEIVSLINNSSESSEGCRDNLDRMFYNAVSEILE